MQIKFQLSIIYITCCLSALATAQFWRRQRDDTAEYRVDKSVENVRGEPDCTMLASGGHQAVQYDSSTATCRLLTCQLGPNGCRKCRNARNSSLPQLLVRLLDEHSGRSCWRTFQHRVDDSVDFYRNWTDYVTGFGQGEELNFWMGLEAIYKLTQAGDRRRIRWEMSLWNGTMFWCENQVFVVQGADQGYRALLGNQDYENSSITLWDFQGTTINGQRFSTMDRDQDSSADTFCAQMFHAGWWFNSCHNFNPNGMYYTPPAALQRTFGSTAWATGMTFQTADQKYPFNNDYSMKTFECLLVDSVE